MSLKKKRLKKNTEAPAVLREGQDLSEFYDEGYFERGLITGKSCYVDYHWMPELTIRMFYYMVKDLPIRDGEKILDYGCAKGYLVRAARILNFEAYGVDVSEYAIAKADPMVSQYCRLIRNGRKLKNLFNIRFDWAIAKDVFEHIPEKDLSSIVRDLARTARKMFVVVPVSCDNQSGKFVIPEYNKDPTHFTVKTDRWWVDFFEKNGFSIERMHYSFRYCKENWTSVWPKGNVFYILKSKTL